MKLYWSCTAAEQRTVGGANVHTAGQLDLKLHLHSAHPLQIISNRYQILNKLETLQLPAKAICFLNIMMYVRE